MSIDIGHEVVPECILIIASVFLKTDFLYTYEIIVRAIS